MSKSGEQLTLPGGRRGATSRSRPGSRPRASRNHSTSSVPYLPQGPEDLIIPDAPIGEGAAELLQEFVHPPHHESEDTLIVDRGDDGPGDEEEGQASDAEWRQSLPWWKRPAPWWFLAFVPFATIAMSATVAPKIEIYTKLACEVHKPEYTIGRDAVEIGFSTLMSYATNSSRVFPLDDQSQRLCASDPVVQAAVAKLTAVMTTTIGVLGCMTTGWWGSLSDRYGRTTILGLSLIGTLVTDFNFIFVYKFSKMLPGGYWFLVCGPIIEGFLGGMSATSAAIHAYIADCTEPGSRSRVFSLFLGVVFTGMGLGPTLGGLLIRFSGNILSVFYGAAGIHVLYAILIWIFVPESLSPLSMTESRKRHVADIEAYRRANTNGGAFVLLKKVFGFLSPLNLFFPTVINDGRNPVKHAQRDWSLLFIVAAYGCTVTLMGSYTYTIQYLSSTFHWTSEQLSYWFSLVGIARAVYLMFVLPVAIKLLKPKPPAIQLPVEPAEPLQPPTGPPSPSSSPANPSESPTIRPSRPSHSPSADLKLARASLLIDMAAYVLMPLSTSAALFCTASVVSAFGMGFAPAVQSVALALYTRRGGKESGKLFGALSVVQAMCSQIFGPFLFGVTYAKTVATFPKAIFLLAAAVVSLSFVFLALVRLPKDTGDLEGQVMDESTPLLGREETLVEEDLPLILVEDEERGRAVVKP